MRVIEIGLRRLGESVTIYSIIITCMMLKVTSRQHYVTMRRPRRVHKTHGNRILGIPPTILTTLLFDSQEPEA